MIKFSMHKISCKVESLALKSIVLFLVCDSVVYGSFM